MEILEKKFLGELTINDIMYAHRHDLSYKDMVGFKNDMAKADTEERLAIAKADSKSMRYYDTPQETTHFAW